MAIEVTRAFEKMVFKIKGKEIKASLLKTIQRIQKVKNLTQISTIIPVVGHIDYYGIVVATHHKLGIKFENNIAWLLYFGVRHEKTYTLFP